MYGFHKNTQIRNYFVISITNKKHLNLMLFANYYEFMFPNSFAGY